MKLIATAKGFLTGLIVITILAFILIQVLDFPIMSTKKEMTGTLNEIYQSQARWHIGEDRLLVQLDNGEIVQARVASGVDFRKGKKVLISEYTTGVLRRKVYLFERYVEDNK